MDFGKIPNFFEVDFSLPEDHSQNQLNLKGSNKPLKVYLGSPVWSNRGFVGKIFPERTKQSNYLHEYAKHFQSIELNTTHYQTPSKERVQTWCSKVTEGFKFCPKFPQVISHAPGDFSLLNQEIEGFLNSLLYFEDHLGISFIQFSEYFDISHYSILSKFIERFPSNIPLAIELRHTSWFEENKMTRKFYQLLNSKKISMIISDVAGRRDVLHMRLTSKTAFIRFTGNSLHSSDFIRLDDWVEKITHWKKLGLETLYFFLHQPDESQCVELSQYLGKKLNPSLMTPLLLPKLLKKQIQTDLFDE